MQCYKDGPASIISLSLCKPYELLKVKIRLIIDGVTK